MAEMRVHLFKVRTMHGAEPLEDLLAAIHGHALDQRVRKLGEQEIRLESLEPPNAAAGTLFWSLDFTNMRFDHGPGKISRIAPIEGFDLDEHQGFGEETAALFDPVSQYLLIQYNHHGPRSSKIEEYFCNYDNAVVGKYSLHVVLDESANVRLAQKDVITKLQVKVASPRMNQAQHDANVSLGRVVDIANSMNGETIDITISAGHGSLTNLTVRGMIDAVKEMIPGRGDPVDGPLRTFKIWGKNGVNGTTDEINMLLAKEELSIDGIVMGDDLRFTQASRWQALLRARRGWQDIIRAI